MNAAIERNVIDTAKEEGIERGSTRPVARWTRQDRCGYRRSDPELISHDE
jgi:hypothetical protein